MAAIAKRPIVVDLRTLLRALRTEARRVWTDRRTADLMVDVAARDLISAGIVKPVRKAVGWSPIAGRSRR